MFRSCVGLRSVGGSEEVIREIGVCDSDLYRVIGLLLLRREVIFLGYYRVMVLKCIWRWSYKD